MNLFQKEILANGIIGALFLSRSEQPNPSVLYLTGYVGSGYLYVPANGRATLFAPDMDAGLAKRARDVTIVVVKEKLIDEVKKQIGVVKELGTDFGYLTVPQYERLKKTLAVELKDVSEILSVLRQIKQEHEIKLIQKACNITDSIFKKFTEKFKNFKTESQATAFLANEARLRGCGLAFEPIVATGKNAAIPHHLSDDKIRKGFCIVDYGVKYRGYCSDVTRTFFVGKPTPEEKESYNSFLKLQIKAISEVRAGVAVASIHKNVENVLRERFNHAIGHGLGIEVHEAPAVSGNTEIILKNNMVITIEPGDYVIGKYGMRIEDDLIVTANGSKVLSKFTKELICL